jgi:hypothetical protein
MFPNFIVLLGYVSSVVVVVVSGQLVGSIEPSSSVPYSIRWRVLDSAGHLASLEAFRIPWTPHNYSVQFDVEHVRTIPDTLAGQMNAMSDKELVASVISADLQWFTVGFNRAKKTMVQSDFYFAFMLPSGLCRIEDRWFESHEVSSNGVPSLDITNSGGLDNLGSRDSKVRFQRSMHMVIWVAGCISITIGHYLPASLTLLLLYLIPSAYITDSTVLKLHDTLSYITDSTITISDHLPVSLTLPV